MTQRYAHLSPKHLSGVVGTLDRVFRPELTEIRMLEAAEASHDAVTMGNITMGNKRAKVNAKPEKLEATETCRFCAFL
jgi:hypothetical protein